MNSFLFMFDKRSALNVLDKELDCLTGLCAEISRCV